MSSSTTTRTLARPLRIVLFVSAALVFVAGVQLFVLSSFTDRFFAWEIQPPLTAASLGAAYWSALFLELGAARSRTWNEARIAVPGVLVFTSLVNIPIVRFFGDYDLSNPFSWAWIVVYATVPFIMIGAIVHQLRQPAEQADQGPATPVGLRCVLGVQAAVLLGLGLVFLFAAPERADAFWPWDLSHGFGGYGASAEDAARVDVPTPAMPQYYGAWLVGIGIVAAQGAWERHLRNLRALFVPYMVLGALQLVALGRSLFDLQAGPALWCFLAVVLSFILVGFEGRKLAVARCD